jgi:hypothetical protein
MLITYGSQHIQHMQKALELLNVKLTTVVFDTAHRIAARVYRLLKHGEAYVRKEMADYEENYRKQLLKGLARRAKEMGYRLEPAQAAPE